MSPTFADEGGVAGRLVVLVAQDEEGALALDLPAHRRTHLHPHRLPQRELLLISGRRRRLLARRRPGLAAAAASAPRRSQVQRQALGADPEGVGALQRRRRKTVREIGCIA